MKILVVGDIHTKLWVVNEAEQLVNEYDAVVFVGDYADDWNSSPMQTIETWNYLRHIQKKYPDKIRLVTGNHDYIYANYTKTLASGYNHITQSIIDAPVCKYLKKWLKDLPAILELDGVTFSHAGLTTSYADGTDLWKDDSPLWARPFNEQYRDIPQVFGHTPSETCWEVRPNVWCIDTFSTKSDGTPIGDWTALEILDGKHFKKVQFEG